jgi:DNA-binding XRE family transcriptional regulator
VRTIDVPADEVRRVRSLLMLSQAELAARLGVSRRTIIRGEERGMETPWWSRNPERSELRKRWNEVKAEAETKSPMAAATGKVRIGDTARISNVSRAAGGDTSRRIHGEVSQAATRPSSRKCHSDTQRPARPGRDRRRRRDRPSVTKRSSRR